MIKKDLINLKNVIDGWKLTTTKYYMNEADWDSIKAWAISEEDVILEAMEKIDGATGARKYFITRIKDGKNLDTLRKVIGVSFPQYLELLDKLLVLR